jgi:hypothetical protein
MKRTFIFLSLVIMISFSVQAQWKAQGDKIKAIWADNLDPNAVWQEYPRPLMQRGEWENLNGLWDYAVLPFGKSEPAAFDGKILVPFAIESSLSGVMKEVGSANELWYKRTFDIPQSWKGKSILLHFGAVDWRTEIFVNDIKVGEHQGGYTPFNFDITPYLIKTGKQKLVVKVWDPTDDGYQPVGKQAKQPEGIWYTSVTGIWQTVWIEPVPVEHITSIRTTPDIDHDRIRVEAILSNALPSDWLEVKLKDGQTVVATSRIAAGQAGYLSVPSPKLWSPDSPFLYDMEIALLRQGKTVDKVISYTAMRKFSTKRDEAGIVRLQLNNKDIFHFGPLDQGWWPDGLYTAPCDEALLSDIQKTKDLGFNMIRKHVKVEPARWYAHCDRLGIIVWQDMPSGEKKRQEWQMTKYFDGREVGCSPEAEADYRAEWKDIIDFLYSQACIGVWVPFNEAWGQFKTKEIAEWTKSYDPSRILNPASGGNHYFTGDILDLHHYPQPRMYLYDPDRATVLGEYGGLGLPVEGHLWQADKNWGYVQFKSSKEVTDEYVKLANQLKDLIRTGFSAAVYTQTTDVEIEINGLMTYDRKVMKLDEVRLKQINTELCKSLGRN